MIKTGRVQNINKNYREWFIGDFIKEADFNNKNVDKFEVKWSNLDKGQKYPLKEKVVDNQSCKSMAILIRGKFKYTFLEKEIFTDYVIENEGDYIYWTPDINHQTEALEESVVMTIRWYFQ